MTTLKELVALVNDAEESRQANELRLAAQKLGRAAELAKGLNRPRLLAVIFMRMGQTFQADGETQHAVSYTHLTLPTIYSV